MPGDIKDPVDSTANPEGKADGKFVSYDSHAKLLDEKKKLQAKFEEEKAAMNARLAELEAAQKAREEAELSAQKRFEELAKMREDEAKAAKKETEKMKALFQAREKELELEKKKQLVLSKVQFKRPEYAEKFLDLEAIDLSDSAKFESYVATLKNEYADLIVQSAATPPSTQAPRRDGVASEPKSLAEAKAAYKQELREKGLSDFVFQMKLE
jgi:hypothetical protein